MHTCTVTQSDRNTQQAHILRHRDTLTDIMYKCTLRLRQTERQSRHTNTQEKQNNMTNTCTLTQRNSKTDIRYTDTQRSSNTDKRQSVFRIHRLNYEAL